MGRHGGHPSLKKTLTLEGCSPLQLRNPIKAQHYARVLVAAKRTSHHQRGAEGPDALQVLIKVPMAVSDQLEICS